MEAASGTIHKLEQNIAPLVKQAVLREDAKTLEALGDLEEGQALDYPEEGSRTTEGTGKYFETCVELN